MAVWVETWLRAYRLALLLIVLHLEQIRAELTAAIDSARGKGVLGHG